MSDKKKVQFTGDCRAFSTQSVKTTDGNHNNKKTTRKLASTCFHEDLMDLHCLIVVVFMGCKTSRTEHHKPCRSPTPSQLSTGKTSTNTSRLPGSCGKCLAHTHTATNGESRCNSELDGRRERAI